MTCPTYVNGTRSERIYGAMLRLYPPAFQKRFRDEMSDVFSQMIKDESALRVWTRTMREFPGHLLTEHATDFSQAYADGAIPRINGAMLIAGVVLLAPGIIVFTLGLFGSAILHDHAFLRTIAGGFLSDQETMRVLVIVLPLLAAFTNMLPLSLHIKRHGMSLSYVSARESALNALLAAAAVSLVAFLLLHDSVHCVVQNPLTTITQWQQTLSCIQRG